MKKTLPEYIGTATVDKDGTLVLDLIAIAEDGTRGRGQLKYPVGHPQFAYIAQHVGDIPPGKSVPVRPFPSADGR